MSGSLMISSSTRLGTTAGTSKILSRWSSHHRNRVTLTIDALTEAASPTSSALSESGVPVFQYRRILHHCTAFHIPRVDDNTNCTRNVTNQRHDAVFQLRRSSRSHTTLSDAVLKRVEAMSTRHQVVLSKLQSNTMDDEDNTSSHHYAAATATADAASLGKELASLAPAASLYERLQSLYEERASLEELLREALELKDDELQTECQEEIRRLEETTAGVERLIIDAVLPQDEDDFGSDAVMEIRAGTGGDEAALFAAELLATYEKTAKARGWKFEVLSQSKTDIGGLKEAAVSISGPGSGSGGGFTSYGGDELNEDVLSALGPYGYFKFESGVHRVQRIPVNDVRIHTSACAVAVLPAPDTSASGPDTLLPMSELKIETMRASGAGGQHVNTTDSAIRITHIPTGITASIQDERSQHKNKAKALKLISARVRDKLREEEAKERGDARNSLMGGGDRSERIRTYNFPQDRVTDHRCKHTEHGIEKLLGGVGDDGLVAVFAPMMRTLYREESLKALEEEDSRNRRPGENEEKGKRGLKNR